MSILHGYINYNTQKEDEVVVKQMIQSSSKVEYDRKRIYCKKKVSLAALIRNTTPESVFDKSPYKYKDWVISSYSRLDNRAFLLKEFEIEDRDTPDSLLIVKSYEKWGESCLKYLEGDWIISIWDERKEELFLAKDFHGNTGVYYHYNNGQFFYSSLLKSIVEIQNIRPHLNTNYFIENIIDVDLTPGETPYEDIFYLPPCHYLRVNNSGIKKVKYWSISDINSIEFINNKDYYERFYQLYREAVNKRIRYINGRVGSTLSGGLDSSSVSVLAANTLNSKNIKLQSYVSYPKLRNSSFSIPGWFVDERPYAHLIANYNSNIELSEVNGEEYSVINAINKITEFSASPDFASQNRHWLLSMFNKAKNDQVGVLLNGQEGNNTVSWKGRGAQKSLNNISLIKSRLTEVLPFLKGYQTKRTTINLFKRIISKNAFNKYQVKQSLNKAFRSWFELQNKSSIEIRSYLMGLTESSSGYSWQNSIYASNIEMPDPTTDKKLVEFCFGIPDAVYESGSNDRLLIRNSFVEKLPDKVRLNSKKGFQGMDNWLRLRRDRAEVMSLFEEMKSNKQYNSLLNVEVLESYLNEIASDNTGDKYLKYGAILFKGIAIALFFKYYSSLNNSKI